MLTVAVFYTSASCAVCSFILVVPRVALILLYPGWKAGKGRGREGKEKEGKKIANILWTACKLQTFLVVCRVMCYVDVCAVLKRREKKNKRSDTKF